MCIRDSKAIAALQAEGYTVTGVKVDGAGEYELTAAKGGVSGYTFTTDTITYYLVKFEVGATAAGYGNEIVGNSNFYMTAGDTVTVTFSGCLLYTSRCV